MLGVETLHLGGAKGDAILVELYDDTAQPFVMLIDAGGGQDSAEKICKQVHKYFGGKIDLAINTHPDKDHLGGMLGVILGCEVNHLLLNDPRSGSIDDQYILSQLSMYQPQQVVNNVAAAFRRINETRVAAALTSPRTEVTSGFASREPLCSWGRWSVYILNPTPEIFYEGWTSLGAAKNFCTDDNITLAEAQAALHSRSVIDEPGIDTSPVNNTSLVLLVTDGSEKYLFTGDAGKRALWSAANIADLSNLKWLDVPHHGSRRNVNTSLLEHFRPKTAHISAPGTQKHPSTAVIRALQKVGCAVYSTHSTKGHIRHKNGAAPRNGYKDIDPHPPV